MRVVLSFAKMRELYPKVMLVLLTLGQYLTLKSAVTITGPTLCTCLTLNGSLNLPVSPPKCHRLPLCSVTRPPLMSTHHKQLLTVFTPKAILPA